MRLKCYAAPNKIMSCSKRLDLILFYYQSNQMEEADKTSLVQQRIKKMLENKRKNAVKDDADYMKRLKSGVDITISRLKQKISLENLPPAYD